jgi:Xaa-Pro aminopeptidase
VSDRPPFDFTGRVGALRGRLSDAGVAALLVTHPPNIRYLTGFAGSAGLVLVTGDDVHLVSDGRYATEIERMAGLGARAPLHVHVAPRPPLDTVVPFVPDGATGVEAEHLSLATFRSFEAAWSAAGRSGELVPTSGLVEAGRVVKDAAEIAVLREAAARLSAVLLGVMADITAGLREIDVAAALESGMRRVGFMRPAFDTIVASGPAAALPHARAGSRPLAAGDLVVLDFGGVYNGYCVDLTRTVSIGASDAAALDLYDAVADAQAAALEAVHPGIATAAVDAAARTVLERRGYGDAFVHSTGHGLGLEVHEAPRIGRRRAVPPSARAVVPEPDTLAAGMVITIEPGAYLPGRGGVRIEDDVLVTATGYDLLTTVRRDLVEC